MVEEEMTKRCVLIAGCLAAALLGFAGCSTTTPQDRKSWGNGPVAVEIGGVQTDQFALIEIVSQPRDAMVVVNRAPVGITPRKLKLPVTNQGFLAETITIDVRFVARDVTEASITQSTTLYNTDRAPTRIEFSREKVRRYFENGTASDG